MAKKATKAEVLQEWVEADKSWLPINPNRQNTQQAVQPAYLARGRGLIYRPDPSGRLEPWADCAHVLGQGQPVQFFQSGGHILAQMLDIRSNARTRGPRDPLEEECTLTLLWDSEGTLPCPFPMEINGRCVYSAIVPQADGGLLVYIHGVCYNPSGSIRDLIRYAPSGEAVWKRDLGFAAPLFCPGGIWMTSLLRSNGQNVGDFAWRDLDGEERAHFQLLEPYRRHVSLPEDSDDLWVFTDDQYPMCNLVRLNRETGEEARVRLNNWVTSLHPVGDMVLRLGGGATLLERDTLQVRADLSSKQPSYFLGQDSRGRLWLENKGMVECYDLDLKEISRHRLKGSVMGSHLDGDGTLCVVTYQAKEKLVRVYRIF